MINHPPGYNLPPVQLEGIRTDRLTLQLQLPDPLPAGVIPTARCSSASLVLSSALIGQVSGTQVPTPNDRPAALYRAEPTRPLRHD